MLPRSRSGETATRAVGNGGNLFCVSCDAINSNLFCVDYDVLNSGSFCVNCNAVGDSSFCDNYDAVVPALFCANRVAILSDYRASKYFRARFPYTSSC